jgi:hypothetical protein
MAVIVQLRRDSAANWTAINPVLAEGEAGFELDTKSYKIGDGATAWNDLDYMAGVTVHADLDGLDYETSGHIGFVGEIELAFTYQSDASTVILSVAEGVRIRRVTISIDTGFNGTTPTLSVGHTGDNGGLMASSDNNPKLAGQYEVEPNFLYGGADTVAFYITSSSSTQGSGTLFLEYVKN